MPGTPCGSALEWREQNAGPNPSSRDFGGISLHIPVDRETGADHATNPSKLMTVCDATGRLPLSSFAWQKMGNESDQAGAPAGQESTETAPPPRAGRGELEFIGPFRVLERLGGGGMGVVYKAEQREGVRRMVAVKVIRAGMDTKDVVTRFEVERQALALMTHPNVARVFEAGETPDGRPYIAMEYVPGTPITQFCDQEKLTTRERLELFVQVCHAVQHAHQKGIIHRDLKPSNILVTLLDGKAVPKVIDFGIAKAIQSPLTQRTLHTEIGSLMGTPEYMPPEQAATSGLDVDTRADIYALGVILYELLTGMLPFDAATLRQAGHDGIARFIREVEPPKPSTRLNDASTMSVETALPKTRSIAEIAKSHKTDPRSLLKEVSGDLDWITLKAIEKERARRYETADALALDLRRHMENEPVLARPPGRRYRLGKFVRKHRMGVIATAAVLTVMVLGMVGTSIGFIQAKVALGRAESAEGIATAQKNVAVKASEEAKQAQVDAEKEARRAKAISDFVTVMLSEANPEKSKGGAEVKVIDVLDKAAAECGVKFRDDPETEIGIRRTLAHAYSGLGQKPQAAEQSRKAHELAERTFAHDSKAYLRVAQTELWWLHSAGEDERVEELSGPMLEAATRVFGPTHQVTHAIRRLAVLARAQRSSPSVAEGLLRDLVNDCRADPTPEGKARLSAVLNDLANIVSADGRFAESESLYRECVTLNSSFVAESNLCGAIAKQGRLEEALGLRRRLLARARTELGNNADETISAADHLIKLEARMDRLEDAFALWDEFVQPALRFRSTNDATLITWTTTGGLLACQLHRDADAARLFAEGMAVSRARFSKENGMYQWLLGVMNLGLRIFDRSAWTSQAIRANTHPTIINALYAMPPQSFDPTEVDLSKLTYRIERWVGPGAKQKTLFSAGDVAALQALGDPTPGIYELTYMIPRKGGVQQTTTHWLLISPWELKLFGMGGKDSAPERFAARVARQPDEVVKEQTLVRNYEVFRSCGPFGGNEPFGLTGTSTIKLPGGRYKFEVKVNAGVRLWVGGKLLIDHWPAPDARIEWPTVFGLVDLPGGSTELRIEYFHRQLGPELWLTVEPIDVPVGTTRPSELVVVTVPAAATQPIGWPKTLWDACAAITAGTNANEAEAAARRALESAKLGQPLDAKGMAGVCDGVGWYFSNERRHETAAAFYRRAYALRAAALGPENSVTLTTGYGLSRELLAVGSPAAATEAVEIRRAILAAHFKAGAESQATIQARVNLAQAMRAAGFSEEYNRALNDLLAIARAQQGSADQQAPHIAYHVALTLRDLDERDAEIEAWRIALDVSSRAWGDKHGIDRHVQLGNCLARHGDLAEAETVLRKARNLHGEHTGRTSMLYARTTRDLAAALLAAGKREAALALFREAVEIAGGANGNADDFGDALLALAAALGPDRAEETEATYKRALQHWTSANNGAGKASAGTARAARALGLFYVSQKKYDQAERQLLNAQRHFQNQGRDGAEPRLDTTADLVALYTAWNKPKEAAQWRDRLPPPPKR
ncbi:MAG: pknB 8 [Phycisphaerales bacterium]|nr:pknB 8 [Phycisphaerales bacterium]